MDKQIKKYLKENGFNFIKKETETKIYFIDKKNSIEIAIYKNWNSGFLFRIYNAKNELQSYKIDQKLKKLYNLQKLTLRNKKYILFNVNLIKSVATEYLTDLAAKKKKFKKELKFAKKIIKKANVEFVENKSKIYWCDFDNKTIKLDIHFEEFKINFDLNVLIYNLEELYKEIK